MQNEELYPELVDYIYHNYAKFMSEDELIASGKMTNAPRRLDFKHVVFIKSNLKATDNKNINLMLADGLDVFQNRVVSRIYNEHKNELNLNLCPKCGKIARTPQAKQCRFCFYDWHSQ